MKKSIIVISCLLIAAYVHLSAYGAAAPSFVLENKKGIMINKSEMTGYLVISFFASYCKPCMKEVPALVELEKKYMDGKQISLVLINTDVNDETGQAREKADKFLKKINVTHDYLLDIYQLTIERYNPLKCVPCTFIVDKYNRIIFSEIGAKDDTIERVEKVLQGLKK
jgi:cytochrome c biogenesis protein CcmG, thiol:disulfide interchange protein DsbE